MGCESIDHAFEVEEGEPTPRTRKCLCGAYDWGYMEDTLTLTEMWELPAV